MSFWSGLVGFAKNTISAGSQLLTGNVAGAASTALSGVASGLGLTTPKKTTKITAAAPTATTPSAAAAAAAAAETENPWYKNKWLYIGTGGFIFLIFLLFKLKR